MSSASPYVTGWPYSKGGAILLAVTISFVVIVNPEIIRRAPIPTLFAVAAIAMLAIAGTVQHSAGKLASAGYYLWPYAPARIVFSVVAVLSAVGLYVSTPLFSKSPMIFGIITVGLFGIESLAFEYGIRLSIRRTAGAARLRAREVASFFMRFAGNYSYTANDIETPLGLLNLLDTVGGYILIGGFFLASAWSEWRAHSCPANQSAKAWFICTITRAFLPCFTVLSIGLAYTLGRRAARKLIVIAEMLFPKEDVPKEWIESGDPLRATLAAVFFFAVYVVLALMSDDPRTLSLLLLMTAAIDFNTLRFLKARTLAYLQEKRYAPATTKPEYTLIMARRRIICDYLGKKKHLWREAFRVMGFAVALVNAEAGNRSIAYVVLISTILINEAFASKWSAMRDRELLALKSALRA